MKKTQTIGQLAKSAGVNIETIRYYQRINLIKEPAKPAQGYRTYPEATLKRIIFIKRAQQLGFSLDEIADLLALGEAGGSDHCSSVRQRAEEKQAQISKQIRDLRKLHSTLGELIHSCSESSQQQHCAIVEALSA